MQFAVACVRLQTTQCSTHLSVFIHEMSFKLMRFCYLWAGATRRIRNVNLKLPIDLAIAFEPDSAHFTNSVWPHTHTNKQLN